MMRNHALARVKEFLDTLMAEIRPLPSERSNLDFSYRLNPDAFILHKHARTIDTEVLVAQPHPDMVFATELRDVITVARISAGVRHTSPPPTSGSLRCAVGLNTQDKCTSGKMQRYTSPFYSEMAR